MLTWGVLSDDSAMSAAALVAAKATGAKVVEIAASVSAEEAKELYKTSECVAALISTEARIKVLCPTLPPARRSAPYSSCACTMSAARPAHALCGVQCPCR